MANQSKHPRPTMTAAEIAMARKLYHEKGKEPKEIAYIFDRDRSAVASLSQSPSRGQLRPSEAS